MSIIVKGMKMPEKCGLCDLFHAESPMHCTVVKGHKTVGAPYGMPRPEWCPLVALPDKHGRLGDLDALMEKLGISDDCNSCLFSRRKIYCSKSDDFVDACEAITNAPTIVEAEDSE